MKALGLIQADAYHVDMDQLLENRTLASVPFGGRFRNIDFHISNMTNAGMKNIAILSKQKYRSLMSHVRGGGDWDLDRKQGGLVVLPPFSSMRFSSHLESRIEELQTNIEFISEAEEPYVVLTGCNYIANLNLSAAIEFHARSGAKATALYVKNPANKRCDLTTSVLTIGANSIVKDIKTTERMKKPEGDFSVLLGAYIFNKNDFVDLLEDSIENGAVSLRQGILAPLVPGGNVAAYEVKERLTFIEDVPAYLKASLALLDQDIRDSLFNSPNGPVITRVNDSAPARYGAEAKVSDSIIADDAVIDGCVEHSVIFRGVHVRKGAVVRNSVIMQDSVVGKDAQLNYAVLDKRAVINDGRMLSGYITHPFFVGTDSVI